MRRDDRVTRAAWLGRENSSWGCWWGDAACIICDVAVVYFAPLRLFRHLHRAERARSWLVGKSRSPPLLVRDRRGRRSLSSPAGSEANSQGLTPQRGQKPTEACERRRPARSFYCASPPRVFREGSSRRDREDISPETGSSLPPLPSPLFLLRSENFSVVSFSLSCSQLSSSRD